jgi:aldehyde:ferredoxin oxidoreductase
MTKEELLMKTAVISRNWAAARVGLGMGMGSKKRKLVVVRKKMKFPTADELKVIELRKKYLSMMGGHMEWLKPIGIAFLAAIGTMTLDSLVKNWKDTDSIDFPDFVPISVASTIAFAMEAYEKGLSY